MDKSKSGALPKEAHSSRAFPRAIGVINAHRNGCFKTKGISYEKDEK